MSRAKIDSGCLFSVKKISIGWGKRSHGPKTSETAINTSEVLWSEPLRLKHI